MIAFMKPSSYLLTFLFISFLSGNGTKSGVPTLMVSGLPISRGLSHGNKLAVRRPNKNHPILPRHIVTIPEVGTAQRKKLPIRGQRKLRFRRQDDGGDSGTTNWTDTSSAPETLGKMINEYNSLMGAVPAAPEGSALKDALLQEIDSKKQDILEKFGQVIPDDGSLATPSGDPSQGAPATTVSSADGSLVTIYTVPDGPAIIVASSGQNQTVSISPDGQFSASQTSQPPQASQSSQLPSQPSQALPQLSPSSQTSETLQASQSSQVSQTEASQTEVSQTSQTSQTPTPTSSTTMVTSFSASASSTSSATSSASSSTSTSAAMMIRPFDMSASPFMRCLFTLTGGFALGALVAL